MVHLHPSSLARCSSRLDLSLGIQKDSAWQPDPDGARGVGKSLARSYEDWFVNERTKKDSAQRWELWVSQMGCISSLEWF